MSKKSKKSKKIVKPKKRRPLSIRIRGEDLCVEASFSDEHLSEVLADLIKRVSSSTSSAGTANRPPGPLDEVVAELGRSLRKDQVEVLMNTFDVTQKLLFMEIVNSAQHDHAS